MTVRTAALLGFCLASAPAFAGGAGTVSFLAGSASVTRGGGAARALALGATVGAGDELSTGAASRLEVRFADGSAVRLGPDSKLALREAALGGGGAARFGARLRWGKLWAKVAAALGGESHFDVETENAVAGVRGTTFRVDARRDRSVLVRVYAGAVAVAAANRLPQPAHLRPRQEVAGPREVDRKSYEKLLARMMEVTVSAAGEVGEPAAFTAQSEAKDPWVAWNQQRDGD